jgi:hypothetical protein
MRALMWNGGQAKNQKRTQRVKTGNKHCQSVRHHKAVTPCGNHGRTATRPEVSNLDQVQLTTLHVTTGSVTKHQHAIKQLPLVTDSCPHSPVHRNRLCGRRRHDVVDFVLWQAELCAGERIGIQAFMHRHVGHILKARPRSDGGLKRAVLIVILGNFLGFLRRPLLLLHQPFRVHFVQAVHAARAMQCFAELLACVGNLKNATTAVSGSPQQRGQISHRKPYRRRERAGFVQLGSCGALL